METLQSKSNTESRAYSRLVIGLALVVAVGLAVFSVQYVEFGTKADTQEVDSVTSGTTTVNEHDSIQDSSGSSVDGDVKTYRNDEWGFAFEYPADWEIREPAFGSKVSLFNMAVEPTEYVVVDAILINITPDSWMIPAMRDMRSDGVIFFEVSLSGHTAYQYDSFISGAPSVAYLIPRNGTWFNIKGKKDMLYAPREHESIMFEIIRSLQLF